MPPLTREVTIKTDEFLSDKKGSIIKSLRKFGIEFEVLSPNRESIQKLDGDISDAFGFHHDGSIHGDGVGVEVVTPPMSGKKGEDAIQDLCKRMEKYNYDFNESCGLHVHFDSEGFSPKTSIVFAPIKGMEYQYGTFAVTEKLHSAFVKAGYTAQDVHKMLTGKQEYKKAVGAPFLTYFDFEFAGTPRRIYRNDFKFFTVSREELDILREWNKNGGDRNVAGHKLFTQLVQIQKDDFQIINNERSNLNNLKTIIYAYTAFGDVILSTLPEERRANVRYCQKLIQRVSPFDLEHCPSFAEFEKLWFKGKNKADIDRKKEHHYDESRYYGVNLHSLFGRHGTLEIRWHEGTIDAKTTLYWTAFHQHLIDTIVEGNVHIGDLKMGFDLFSLQEKSDYFFKLFKFPKEIEEYMLERISFFAKEK